MFNLFRINDPLRLLIVALLALIIRLPILLGEYGISLPELQWMLLGEQMSMGKHLYKDIWEHVGPLSSGVYWVVFQLFGKNLWAYQVLAWLLVVYQASIFNFMLIKKSVYNEKTYVPALLYVVFCSASIDFQILSPSLMATTFLLLMLKNMLNLNDYGRDEDIFRVGLFLGIATLFHLPIILFFLVVIWGVGVFRVIAFRQLALIAFGTIIVWGATSVYFLYIDAFANFYEFYLLAHLTIKDIPYASIIDLLWLQLVPFIVAILGFTRVLRERGFINFQVACQRIFFIWLIASFGALLFSPHFAIYQLVPAIPAIAFFATHLLLLYQKGWVAEVVFSALFLAVGLLAHSPYTLNKWLPDNPWSPQIYQDLIAQPKSNWTEQNKSILVLGNDPAYYIDNSLAMPFLNWHLSERYFQSINNYQTVTEVYGFFQENPPEIIIDVSGTTRQLLFEKMPKLQELYKKDTGNSPIYRLKEGE